MQGESLRREAYVQEIDLAMQRIIGSHKLCEGRGIITKLVKNKSTGFPKSVAKICKCGRKFDIVSRFILSGFSRDNLINQKIYKKTVVDAITGDDVDLNSKIVHPFIKHIKKVVNNPYGLIFLGKHGTGKTFVGQKILYYALGNQLTAHYVELSEFLSLLRRGFDEKLTGLINEISHVDILMIDEIGNESKRSGFALGGFKSLYKKRVERNQPTILVSNFSYPEFKKAYGKSIESIASSYAQILDFGKVSDVRKLKATVEMDAFLKRIRN